MDDQRPADDGGVKNAGMKLRFSIRDLFWLAFVVALATGWWLDHKTQRYKVVTEELSSLGTSEILVDNETVSIARFNLIG